MSSPRLSINKLPLLFTFFAVLVAFSPLFAREADATSVCVDKDGIPVTIVFRVNCFESVADCINSNACASGYSCKEQACEAGITPKTGTTEGVFQGLFDISVGFVLKLLNYLLYGISTVLERLVALSAFLLEMAIDVSSAPFSDISILKEGWKIVRDVMNSFFVLILFIIAIATILQLESYAWKQLLPWFIIVALLVNFSFVLSGVVIDFSNVLGRTFFDKIQPLSDNIAKAFDINNINNITLPTCSPSVSSGGGTVATIKSHAKGWSCATGAARTVEKLFVEWKQIFDTPVSETDTLTKFLFVLTLRVIMLFLMIFPLLAGAALMIMRTVMLMVLIIFAPAAFTAYILPATRGYATQWWNELFSKSFFFPSYLFLLYIAVNYGIKIGEALKGAQLGGTFSNLATIFNFLTMVAFMFIALSVGRKSGIVGADVVMKYADAGRKWATGYAGRMTGVPRLSERLAESGAAQRFAARFPTLGGATLRTLQKGATLGGREAALKKQVDTAMQLAPRYQATAYLKAGASVRRRLEDQMKPEGIAEMLHYTDDQKTRKKIKDTAFAHQSPDQRKDSQERLKTAYADREANRQSTGQLVGRFDSAYYTKDEEEKIFDEAKTDRRAKVLLRSRRNIAELEQRMLDGIGRRDVREIERTYDEIARNGIEMDSDTLVQKFNQLSKEANQKLYDIIDPGDLREKMKGFNPNGTSAVPEEQAKFDEQKKFLERLNPNLPGGGLGLNKRGIEIRKIVGAVQPTYWQELGYGSQQELVEALSPAEAASMGEEDMKLAAISQHFDGGQLEAIARSQRVTPETRVQIRDNIKAYIAFQRAAGPLTPQQIAHLDSVEQYLARSLVWQ